MYRPIEGGSSKTIRFDDQEYTVYLPPVGKVIDFFTGKLVDSETLFIEEPVPNQKWRRTKYPKDWSKWISDEKLKRKKDAKWLHPEAEEFRKQEWRRRLNGVWMAIGNRNGDPSEYVYLTGLAYFYFQWWKNDFGYGKFRFTYLKVFYMLAWAEQCPWCLGLTLSTLRRYGKTAILGCFIYEYPSRRANSYGGMQGQNDEEAKKKYTLNILHPWRQLPEFFRPIYNYDSKQTEMLEFIAPMPKGAKAQEYRPEEDESLFSYINFKESSVVAYDGDKLHRYGMEEPGKTEKVDVYQRWDRIRPSFKEGPKKIGIAFAPTTIEEMNEGGATFVKLFEDSFISTAKKNKNGKTTSELVSLFISADEGYIFDEYGRSVIYDPLPDQIVFDEDNNRILKGARTIILEDRQSVAHDPIRYSEVVRKYPLSWAEAKTSGIGACLFNKEILTKRLDELNKMPIKPYVIGNLYYVDGEVDSKVDFQKDEHTGRFKFAWLPDALTPDKKQIMMNNVEEYWGYGIDDKKKKFWKPKNDHLFSLGTDPIKYVNTDDPRSSKAAAYAKWKFRLPTIFKDRQGNVTQGERGYNDENIIFNNNAFAQYLYRPEDPITFFEDMIMLCRYLGSSICIEDNISSLRQHFDSRGYGDFVIYQADLASEIFAIPKDDKAPESVPMVVDYYIRKIISNVNQVGKYYMFEELIEDLLNFEIKNRTKHDATVAWGYTLMGDDIIIQDDGHVDEVQQWMPEYDVNDFKSIVSEVSDEGEPETADREEEWFF